MRRKGVDKQERYLQVELSMPKMICRSLPCAQKRTRKEDHRLEGVWGNFEVPLQSYNNKPPRAYCARWLVWGWTGDLSDTCIGPKPLCSTRRCRPEGPPWANPPRCCRREGLARFGPQPLLSPLSSGGMPFLSKRPSGTKHRNPKHQFDKFDANLRMSHGCASLRNVAPTW